MFRVAGPTAQRLFDVVLASLLLVAALPVLALAVLAVKIEDPRSPAIFVQTRYGRRFRPFGLYKIRTMVPEAERLKGGLIDRSRDKGAGFKLDRDPRITAVGAVLRRFYIDEIPQFLNVLRGDMSIVGPRANSCDPSLYEPWQRIRLAVKPGMTGTWQISATRPERFDDRCRMDLSYVARKGLLYDAEIILRTALMLVTRPAGR